MRILKQSPSLRKLFDEKIAQKKSSRKQAVQDQLGDGFLGAIGAGIFEFQQFKNEVKGNLGENFVSFLSMFLPDTWTMFKNALIPTSNGDLTEIDILLVGTRGVFLIEVKTWKGSFSAYKDKWKRRDGSQWIPIDNSPTQQSLYHQQMFRQWLDREIPGFPENCIVAPVVFPIAKWIGVTDCSVPVCQGVQELKQLIEERSDRLNAEQVLKISELIEDFELSPPSPSVKPKPILRKPIQ